MADALIFSQHLDTTGDGTGTVNAVGDYSSVDGVFYYQAQGGDRVTISRMIVMIEDGASFDADGYGALSVLTNGIVVEITDADDNVIQTLNGSIKSNVEWGGLCYDVAYHDFGGGAANKFLLVRWTFSATGEPIVLDNGEKFKITLSDSFVGLVKHHFQVQGHYHNRRM